MTVIDRVWRSYLESLGEDPLTSSRRWVRAEHFCTEKNDADELFTLVLQGRKRATCSNFAVYEAENEPLPQPGDLTILTDFDQTQACVLRTLSVTIKPFRDITADEARLEGEGDLSLEFWRRSHREFFSRECASLGLRFEETQAIVYEQFTLEYRHPDNP